MTKKDRVQLSKRIRGMGYIIYNYLRTCVCSYTQTKKLCGLLFFWFSASPLQKRTPFPPSLAKMHNTRCDRQRISLKVQCFQCFILAIQAYSDILPQMFMLCSLEGVGVGHVGGIRLCIYTLQHTGILTFALLLYTDPLFYWHMSRLVSFQYQFRVVLLTGLIEIHNLSPDQVHFLS